eukprot:SAG22_NODE_231_length_14551_cov_22.298090_9_plen_72_part_00
MVLTSEPEQVKAALADMATASSRADGKVDFEAFFQWWQVRAAGRAGGRAGGGGGGGQSGTECPSNLLAGAF